MQAVLGRKKVLKTGEEASNFGGVSKVKIGSTEVLVATAKDLERITQIRLKNGAFTSFQPYQIYFVRLNDEITVVLRFLHWNKKKLGPKWHAEAQAMAVSILERMKFTPRE